MIPMSVLDLAPVPSGSTAKDALNRTLELARFAEELGYHRYWMAEHHNVGSVASCSPAVVAGAIASVTSEIRVGSGGVILPNHAPLVVAEQFGTLEALYPGRVDLGVGRQPVTDPATVKALNPRTDTPFIDQVVELAGYFTDKNPVAAIPAGGSRPPIWVLGSSAQGAQLAAVLGFPFAFAHHIAPVNALPALQMYRSAFQPSAFLDRPYVMLAAGVVCGESDEHARWLAAPAGLLYVRLRAEQAHLPFPNPRDAADHHFTQEERELAGKQAATRVIGSPETVRKAIDLLLDATQPDELMITTMVHDHEDRMRSYELIANRYAQPRRRSMTVPA